MNARLKVCTKTLAILLSMAVVATPALAQAQDRQHVVGVTELRQDSARPGSSRQADEAAIRGLLSSAAGEKALKTAKVDYAKVDKAIGQLSDEDAAKLAERSRNVEADFAAGSLSDRDLLIIVIIAVLVIALIAALH